MSLAELVYEPRAICDHCGATLGAVFTISADGSHICLECRRALQPDVTTEPEPIDLMSGSEPEDGHQAIQEIYEAHYA